MVKVLVASGNQKKLAELEAVLAELGIAGVELVSMRDVDVYPEPVEDGLTFEDNALIKARAGAAATGLACVADDSGLAVTALKGMPGVLSARWSGTHGDDAANNALLLAQMTDIALRDAAFVSCCALVGPAGDEFTAEGRWEGQLLREPRGDNGFGYDPIFQPNDADGRSAAQLSAAEKNARSHRSRALRALTPHIADLVSATVRE
ncbi:RdgB/HAM1 family non-canonical purine NTP pyrophosphatase [Corynebacterium sanguinis]|uniref:RdgB/HAM1 family non-canonical purine NTP pyrophosphatase n=1 Tax=Corynebacterium sanguinis TaxID=2594913 RepID=UPI0021AF0914|nr:RdgB/HAM1 family non-canonical purine NTP pyrophosphatase [Corynebacterium sanguinis]MCT1555951.1 RdgB/HAM1 family non-canonical purine NTP pyrophosphatase [Corynebacterium sanguinis]MCT1614300.1 RdgB/HAM1 family non-canonical purine NTP pyrophosphatase [Corynebacterium sanguinis]MCT1664499.1 RdgB/HAM1 family non-canonical purine NTP pyrophosphatase [Corynebacterium sanguinis]